MELKREADQRIERHVARNKIASLYPDEGLLRRALYPKHLAFFAAGVQHQERAILGGNRTGKTTAAAYELTCHLTGHYPHWWVGRRFQKPIIAWAAGEDAKSVRESIQPILFGPPDALGTGMIPFDCIDGKPTARSGTAEAYDAASIKYANGGKSRCVLKAYDQGREAFQAAKVDVAWADEEPPEDIYTEFLTRTMSTVPGEPSGILMATLTPLKGMSSVIQGFLGDNWLEARDEPSLH